MIIELNEKQARLIATALEQYSRMICGQLELNKMPSLEQELYKNKELNDAFWKRRDDVETQLSYLKELIHPLLHSNASYGIGYDKEADLGYEMYKMILHYFEMQRAKEEGDKYRSNVHSYLPLELTEEPLIKIIS